ncbi:MAG: hypothetical protein AAF916_07020 [Planctomycetota bacterium]
MAAKVLEFSADTRQATRQVGVFARKLNAVEKEGVGVAKILGRIDKTKLRNAGIGKIADGLRNANREAKGYTRTLADLARQEQRLHGIRNRSVARTRAITRVGNQDLNLTATGRAAAASNGMSAFAIAARQTRGERTAVANLIREKRSLAREQYNLANVEALHQRRMAADAARLSPLRRIDQARAADARELASRTHYRTRGTDGSLDISAAGRAAARLGGTGRFALEAAELSERRRERAAEIRQRRAAESGRVRRRERSLRRRELGRSAVRHGFDLAGAASMAGYGLAARYDQDVELYGSALRASSDYINPLAGVDNNAIRRAALRREVQERAVSTGIGAQQIAGARFTLESAAADLPPAVRERMLQAAIEYNQLQQSDMGTIVGAVNSAYQLVGKQYGGGERAVRTITNKMAYAADVGAFEVDQMAPYQSMVLSSFSNLGFTPDEALSAMALASRSGMRPETLMTGVRNLPMVATLGQKKGFDKADTFEGLLQQFSEMPAEDVLEVTGRDPYAALSFLVENRDKFGAILKTMQAINAESDVLGKKLAKFQADPAYMPDRVNRSAEELADQAPSRVMDESARVRDAVTSAKIIEAGRKLETTMLTSLFTHIGAKLEQANNEIYQASGDRAKMYQGEYFKRGIETLIADASPKVRPDGSIDPGDQALAGYLRLHFEDNDPKGSAEFLRLRAAGNTDLTGGEFREYQRLKQNGTAEQADAYLQRHGRTGGATVLNSPKTRGGMFDFSKPFTFVPPDPLVTPRASRRASSRVEDDSSHRAVAGFLIDGADAALSQAESGGNILAIGQARQRLDRIESAGAARKDGVWSRNEVAGLILASEGLDAPDEAEARVRKLTTKHRAMMSDFQADGVIDDEERWQLSVNQRQRGQAEADLKVAMVNLKEATAMMESMVIGARGSRRPPSAGDAAFVN